MHSTTKAVHRPGKRSLRGRACVAAVAMGALGLTGLLAPQVTAADRADGADAARGSSAAAVAATRGNTTDAEIDRFWTKERIRQAKAVDVPTVSAAQIKAAQEKRDEGGATDPDGSTNQNSGGVDPKAHSLSAAAVGPAMATKAGTSGAGANVLAVDRAKRFNKQGTMPATTTGKLLFETNNGHSGSCSGSAIVADNRNTVWTAGHCVHPGDGSGPDQYKKFIFIPDADNAKEPFGQWKFERAVTTEGWMDNGDHEFDLAGVEFRSQSTHGDLQAAVGAQGYKFGYGRDWDDVTDLGFPGDGYQRTDFDGQLLWYCQGKAEDSGPFWDDRMVTRCDMGRGSSGGPWLAELDPSNGHGRIVGVNSHRNGKNGQYVDNNLYSADHGDAAINVYNNISK
ncbi:trypsin-like serine peptidase [Streptomyces iconiensis]|uniref:V8-like Glu-specific endopeptidase n=1 Tax=Streptomyces iconiensis TaxID=1384038 RepID=A0ABT7A876_9ACTN|nr:hypothetical protein [Streptomyces iconiensis]MDJ1136828.1 hypothetical protein [Streptomyces iconiensis]